MVRGWSRNVVNKWEKVVVERGREREKEAEVLPRDAAEQNNGRRGNNKSESLAAFLPAV